MADPKKNTPAESLIEALLSEIGVTAEENLTEQPNEANDGLLGLSDESTQIQGTPIDTEESFALTQNAYESTRNATFEDVDELSVFDNMISSGNSPAPAAVEAVVSEPVVAAVLPKVEVSRVDSEESTVALAENPILVNENPKIEQSNGDSEKTLAVTGFQIKNNLNYDDKIKVSVGQNRPGAYSTGYAAWGNGSDSSLAQADNLRMAQDKILELERENEKHRQQNEQLISASEIIKERSDLLTAQVTELKNDREGLEDSFKNEMTLLKNHLGRKDAELQRAQFKVDELESRLKFDMKKIRIRERELENRLELIRAEKNAIVKNKDEQILDLRRKMDIVQMEVDSYRQKCVELNKLVEINQESFKRTTRALRLAMANLELQDENKVPLKKVD